MTLSERSVNFWKLIDDKRIISVKWGTKEDDMKTENFVAVTCSLETTLDYYTCTSGFHLCEDTLSLLQDTVRARQSI